MKWINIKDQLPPEGNCSKNQLLLWIKCPDDIQYPEFWRGWEIGFYDTYNKGIFYDINYRYRIDDVTHWMLLPKNPNNLGEKNGIKQGKEKSITEVKR